MNKKYEKNKFGENKHNAVNKKYEKKLNQTLLKESLISKRETNHNLVFF
jgi:hypothetical protein